MSGAGAAPELIGPDLVAQLAGLIRQVAGEDGRWPRDIGPQTRLDGDLFLDSVDLAALDAALRQRFGAAVDLVRHVAGLDIDGITALTVGDVAAYVAQRAGAR
ncbi:MAG TPA: acyl carrier protein [Actinocrinis sp.]